MCIRDRRKVVTNERTNIQPKHHTVLLPQKEREENDPKLSWRRTEENDGEDDYREATTRDIIQGRCS